MKKILLEEELRKSNDWFFQIFNGNSIGMLVTDLETTRYQLVNSAFLEISGYTKEEVIHKTALDLNLLDPVFRANKLAHLREQGSLNKEEMLIRKKNGETFWALVSVQKLIVQGFNYAITSFIDISEQKNAEALQAQLAAIVESSNDAIISKLPNGTILTWNNGAEKMFGYTSKEAMGANISLIIPPEYFNEELENMSRLSNLEPVEHYETMRVKKNGQQINVSLTVSPIKDQSGSIVGFCKIARDITDQKKASYARNLIEASLDPLVTISAGGKITDVNEASVKVTGISRENLIGTDFSNYFTNPEKARQGYQQVFEKGFVSNYPLTIKNIHGDFTEVMYNASVYKDNQGQILGVFATARDITVQKKIETELVEAKVFAELATLIAEEAKNTAEGATVIAEDAMRSKQQFLSNMSHEIRTPMNAIIGFTKVVLKTDLSPKQKEYLSAIKTSGDALIVLINDILDLAKVDSGKMTFEQIPFKMEYSISAMLHLFESKIQEKNLKLVKEYDQKIPGVLLGDAVRLHQIILNLVSNAVKFTSKGKITVSVRLLKEEEETSMVEFEVADTGIGIGAEHLERVFENFQQASSGTSRLFGGTGLGLAIAKNLVEQQGGSIRVVSKVGEGSTFSFILPFQKTDAEAKSESTYTALDTEVKNIKVLVVEDMELNQLLMKTLLDDFGFERDIAANGKIALEKLQSKTYDIILMDLQMPEMNGFEATEHIRNIMKSKIPIIALTADVTTVDLEKCKAAGMNDYIAKPIDERILYTKIMGAVMKPSLNPVVNEHESVQSKNVKYTDLEYLTLRTKNDASLMMEMIAAYLEQTPPLITAMKKGLMDKDWGTLHAAVHKMIPSFSIMGMHPDFESMAKKIQEYARSQQQIEGISDMVLQVEKVCTQACAELTEEFHRFKNTTHAARV